MHEHPDTQESIFLGHFPEESMTLLNHRNSEVAPTLPPVGPLSSTLEPAWGWWEPGGDGHTHLGPGLGGKTSGRTERQKDTEQSKGEPTELADGASRKARLIADTVHRNQRSPWPTAFLTRVLLNQ